MPMQANIHKPDKFEIAWVAPNSSRSNDGYWVLVLIDKDDNFVNVFMSDASKLALQEILVAGRFDSRRRKGSLHHKSLVESC